jgi:hypothetical protein
MPSLSRLIDRKDFSTTLLLAAHKKMAAGEFVAAYWVGNGGVGVYKRGEFVKLLGDGGRALLGPICPNCSNAPLSRGSIIQK